MRKTLFSICALALSFTASAQIVDTPKGKLIDNMYRSSESWVKKGWIGTEPGVYEGLVSKIVEGEDGCLYVYNPLSGLDSKSWLKLDKVSDGKYKAALPQVFHKDTSGGDDDEDSGNSERIFTLNRMSIKDNNQYEVVAANKNYMEYTWDGSTLKMLGVGSKNEILGMVDNSNTWDNHYGDWSVTIQTFDNKLVTPPASAVKKQYSLTCKGETSPRIIEAAVDGNDIYLKGISKSAKLANAWVKLTTDGNKAVLLTNQYLGKAIKADFLKYSNDPSEYHAFAAAFNDATTIAEKLEFSINTTNGVLTNDKVLRIMMGKSSESNIPKEDLEVLENLVLTPFQQKAAKPETPKLHYCSAVESYDYSTTTITLAFYVRNVDVDGNYLDPDKMYYNVYLGDSTEPFKFTKAQFFYIEKDMIDIPFNYQDKKNEDIKVVDDQRILHFYDPSIKKISVVMVYEEDGKKYSSEPMTTEVVYAGIENATINDNTTEKYYSVDGYRLQHLQKGLNIVKSSNGTTKKIFVK
ncbi:hypothetical protein [Prevotella falsenii]|uniref:hypothetical protein n=1 Tax=Prevotella falsenii TaxID=515414 RepID=UPI00046881E7|nr:hypothetical protein [Prevotella falsenii]